MTPSITIARIAGIRIGVNWSWLVVFALIVWSLATAVFPEQNPGLSDAAYAGMGVVAAILFFSSLLLHELGHALQARRDGMEIDSITLWLFGGVARFKGMFPSAGAEFRIAIAGPLVSVAIGGIAVAVAAAASLPEAVDGVAAWLGYINLLLVGFNLLPALPLDGGRVLRSALWRWKGSFEASTQIAVDVARGFAYLFIAGGVGMLIFLNAWSGVWLAFIGWFLLLAAGSEARYALARSALAGLYVSDIMVREPVTARASETLGEFMDGIAFSHRYTTYPVTEAGHVVGLLPFSCVAGVPRAEWDRRLVRDCMVPRSRLPILREDEELIEALGELSESPLQRGLVLDGDRLVGFVSISDLARILHWRQPQL
jgi:Zn-dependent protease